MSIFMQYGTKVKGESATTGYADWIQVDSFQFGVGRGISAPTGGTTTKREASEASVSEITVTKSMDKASVGLLREAIAGKTDTTVKLDFTRTKAGTDAGVEAYLQIELSDTTLSGFSVSSGGDNPTESVSLNYGKIQYKYLAYKADGTSTPDIATYNLSTRGLS